MATWKKIIVSGSSAHLLDVTASNLTQDFIVIAGSGGALESTNLKYSASIFEFGNATVSGSIFSGSQFSGSFFGDGSGLTGITAEWDGTHEGDASITGSFTVSGSTGAVVDFTGVDAISGSIFSGSFVGDGSGLTGIAATLGLSGSIGTGSVDLKSESLTVLGTEKEVEVEVSASTITIGLPDNVDISGSLIVSGSLTGSNALFSYIQVSGSVINDLTASFAMNAETTAINSGTSLQVTPATASWILNHGLNTRYPIVTVWDSATNKIIEPDEVTSLSGQTIKIDFTTPVAGWVNISRAGHVVSGSVLWENLIAGPSGSQVLISDDVLGITGSLEVTNGVSGSFSGSFEGDGSKLTGIAATLTFSGSEGTGAVDLKTESLNITGSANGITTSGSGADLFINLADHVIVNQLTAATSSMTGSFTGSFFGDGSGLTGVAAEMFVSASGGGSGSVDLKTAALIISGSANEIEVTFNDATNTLTIGLPDDVTITNDLTVEGDLIVNGNTTVINTTEVLVEDKFIILASGSTSPTDGGIIIQSSGSAEGFGFGMDASSERWALQKGMESPSTTITPDAYVTATQFGAEANQPQYPAYGATGSAFGNIWVSTDTGDIYIWA